MLQRERRVGEHFRPVMEFHLALPLRTHTRGTAHFRRATAAKKVLRRDESSDDFTVGTSHVESLAKRQKPIVPHVITHDVQIRIENLQGKGREGGRTVGERGKRSNRRVRLAECTRTRSGEAARARSRSYDGLLATEGRIHGAAQRTTLGLGCGLSASHDRICA